MTTVSVLVSVSLVIFNEYMLFYLKYILICIVTVFQVA